jgi:hypothetical protein
VWVIFYKIKYNQIILIKEKLLSNNKKKLYLKIKIKIKLRWTLIIAHKKELNYLIIYKNDMI